MPYITFSRNVKNPRVAKKILEKSGVSDGSIVVLRGKKSVGQIVKDALSKGFTSVLIANNSGKAIEIKLNQNDPKDWRYGKTIVIK